MDTLLPIVYFFFLGGGGGGAGVCLMSNLSCFSLFFSAISNIFLKRLRFH